MTNDIDHSKIKTRKGKVVYGCLFFGIMWVFPMILYLADIIHGKWTERLAAMIVGICGMILLLGSIILLVKTRHVSYGLWCKDCNMFVDGKRKRCNVCRSKRMVWKRLPR